MGNFSQEKKHYAKVDKQDKKNREIYKGCPYKRFWRMVLGQAVIDAFSTSRKQRAKSIRLNAMHWLLIPSEDYNLVCTLCSTDPDFFRQSVLKALNNPNQDSLVLDAYALIVSGMYNPTKRTKSRLMNRFGNSRMRKDNMC